MKNKGRKIGLFTAVLFFIVVDLIGAEFNIMSLNDKDCSFFMNLSDKNIYTHFYFRQGMDCASLRLSSIKTKEFEYVFESANFKGSIRPYDLMTDKDKFDLNSNVKVTIKGSSGTVLEFESVWKQGNYSISPALNMPKDVYIELMWLFEESSSIYIKLAGIKNGKPIEYLDLFKFDSTLYNHLLFDMNTNHFVSNAIERKEISVSISLKNSNGDEIYGTYQPLKIYDNDSNLLGHIFVMENATGVGSVLNNYIKGILWFSDQNGFDYNSYIKIVSRIGDDIILENGALVDDIDRTMLIFTLLQNKNIESYYVVKNSNGEEIEQRIHIFPCGSLMKFRFEMDVEDFIESKK